MKIRNGFVSNSSSSSFIVIGKKINVCDLKVGDFVIGNTLCEGRDAFTIEDKEMLKFVKEHNQCFYYFFTNARLICSDSEDGKVDARDVGNVVYGFQKDYHSSDDIEQLRRYYEDT